MLTANFEAFLELVNLHPVIEGHSQQYF